MKCLFKVLNEIQAPILPGSTAAHGFCVTCTVLVTSPFRKLGCAASNCPWPACTVTPCLWSQAMGSEGSSLLLRAQHHKGPLQSSGLRGLHTLCPGLPLCCAEILLGVMKAGANHAGTTKTIPGLCVLPQKSLIPLVTPVNLFPQQACTRSCSCPKETCGRTSVSERLSNSVHNCRDMSLISNSLCRKGRLFFPSDHVATESGYPMQIL